MRRTRLVLLPIRKQQCLPNPNLNFNLTCIRIATVIVILEIMMMISQYLLNNLNLPSSSKNSRPPPIQISHQTSMCGVTHLLNLPPHQLPKQSQQQHRSHKIPALIMMLISMRLLTSWLQKYNHHHLHLQTIIRQIVM